MTRRRRLQAWLPVLLLAAVAPSASAVGAAPGQLLITVRGDEQPVAAARVTIASVTPLGDGEARRETGTDARGECRFPDLGRGSYQVVVEAEGFEAARVTASISGSTKKLGVTLRRIGFSEEIDVYGGGGDVSGRLYMTAEEIAALPDDPEEMQRALRAQFGSDVVIRVNGFSGGRLPRKSQIRSIRLRLDEFSAENHELGFRGLDVSTVPGDEGWGARTTVAASPRGANARPARAGVALAPEGERADLDLDGPLRQGKSSWRVSLRPSSSAQALASRVARPGGVETNVSAPEDLTTDLEAGTDWILGQSHVLHTVLQSSVVTQRQQGLQIFDLPERAYERSSRDLRFRLSAPGSLGPSVLHEPHLEVVDQRVNHVPLSQAPVVEVLEAFRAGGAQVQGGTRSRRVLLSDSFDFRIKAHSLRGGIAGEYGSYTSDEARNLGGTYVFSSLDDYENGRVALFTRSAGDPRVRFTSANLSAYLQDEFALRPSLSLGVGLRQQAQTRLGGAVHLAPRANLKWTAGPKDSLSLGGGLFRAWLDPEVERQVLLNDGAHLHEIRVGQATDGVAGPAAVTARRELASDLALPRTWMTALRWEHRLSATATLSARYTLQRGEGGFRTLNVNAPGVDGTRPHTLEGDVLRLTSSAPAWGRGFQATFSYMPRASSFFATYLWGRSTDEVDSPLMPPTDNAHPSADRGPATFESRHRIIGYCSVKLPQGFRLTADGSVFSPSPYSITTGRDDNGDGFVNDRPEGVGRNSARASWQTSLDLRLQWTRGFGPRRAGGARPLQNETADNADVREYRGRLKLFVHATNPLNHPTPVGFVGVRSSPLFGQAVSTMPPRKVEVGLSVEWR